MSALIFPNVENQGVHQITRITEPACHCNVCCVWTPRIHYDNQENLVSFGEPGQKSMPITSKRQKIWFLVPFGIGHLFYGITVMYIVYNFHHPIGLWLLMMFSLICMLFSGLIIRNKGLPADFYALVRLEIFFFFLIGINQLWAYFIYAECYTCQVLLVSSMIVNGIFTIVLFISLQFLDSFYDLGVCGCY